MLVNLYASGVAQSKIAKQTERPTPSQTLTQRLKQRKRKIINAANQNAQQAHTLNVQLQNIGKAAENEIRLAAKSDQSHSDSDAACDTV